MSRRVGRILAFQALYSYDLCKTPIKDLLEFDWIDKNTDFSQQDLKIENAISVGKSKISLSERILQSAEFSCDEKNYARILISGAIENLGEIDLQIQKYSKTRAIERINRPTLAVLRMAIYSLAYQKEADANVIIDEAVSIAKDFGTEDSYKFVNAVLDKISKSKIESKNNEQEELKS